MTASLADRHCHWCGSADHDRRTCPGEQPAAVVSPPRLPPLRSLALYERKPATRGECADMPRPCPWASCEHHVLALRLMGDGADADIDIDKLPDTCVLDAADRGGITLDEVGVIMDVVKERVRQIQDGALKKMKRRAVAFAQRTGTGIGEGR